MCKLYASTLLLCILGCLVSLAASAEEGIKLRWIPSRGSEPRTSTALSISLSLSERNGIRASGLDFLQIERQPDWEYN